jgi:hypothetical protein
MEAEVAEHCFQSVIEIRAIGSVVAAIVESLATGSRG